MDYKQGYSDRKDESLGMKDGKESTKMQSFKSRRDESYGMDKVFRSEKKPMKINAFEAQRSGMNKGYPKEAYDYKHK